jgi:hypothetical protein
MTTTPSSKMQPPRPSAPLASGEGGSDGVWARCRLPPTFPPSTARPSCPLPPSPASFQLPLPERRQPPCRPAGPPLQLGAAVCRARHFLALRAPLRPPPPRWRRWWTHTAMLWLAILGAAAFYVAGSSTCCMLHDWRVSGQCASSDAHTHTHTHTYRYRYRYRYRLRYISIYRYRYRYIDTMHIGGGARRRTRASPRDYPRRLLPGWAGGRTPSWRSPLRPCPCRGPFSHRCPTATWPVPSPRTATW